MQYMLHVESFTLLKGLASGVLSGHSRNKFYADIIKTACNTCVTLNCIRNF